jgi:hypothetical protein
VLCNGLLSLTCAPRTGVKQEPVPNVNKRRRALRGEVTIALADADCGTDILAVHDGLPSGLPTANNEAGWRSSLAKLAACRGGLEHAPYVRSCDY